MVEQYNNEHTLAQRKFGLLAHKGGTDVFRHLLLGVHIDAQPYWHRLCQASTQCLR